MDPRVQGTRPKARDYFCGNSIPIQNPSTARNCGTGQRSLAPTRSLSLLSTQSAYQVRNQSPLHTSPRPRSAVRRLFDLLQIPRVLALAGFTDLKRRTSVKSSPSAHTVISMPPMGAQPEAVNNAGTQGSFGAPSIAEGTRLTIIRNYEYTPKLDESSFFQDANSYLTNFNPADRDIKPLIFIVGHEKVEMMIHGALLKGCQQSFPYHPASDRYVAENTPKNIFIKVREWIYRGINARRSIFEDLCLHGGISQEGINLAVNYYILAQKLGCSWLANLLFDFFGAVHLNLGTYPCNQAIGYVFKNLEERCGLRNYMGLAFQTTFFGQNGQVRASNREVYGMMTTVPGLLKFFVKVSQGILARSPESGEDILEKLEDYPICVFHDHFEGEIGDCYGAGKTTHELLYDCMNALVAKYGGGRAGMVGVADGAAQRPQSTLSFNPASQDQGTFSSTQPSHYSNGQTQTQGYHPFFGVSQHGNGFMLPPQNGMHPGQFHHGFSRNEGQFVQSQPMSQASFLPTHLTLQQQRSGETLRSAATQQTQASSVRGTNIAEALHAREIGGPIHEQPASGAPRHLSQFVGVAQNPSPAPQTSTSSSSRASSSRLEWDASAYRPYVGDLPASAFSQFRAVPPRREDSN